MNEREKLLAVAAVASLALAISACDDDQAGETGDTETAPASEVASPATVGLCLPEADVSDVETLARDRF